MSQLSRLQPYLSVREPERALETYSKVFGMKEVYRLPMGERIGHAELAYGDERLLLASEFPESQHPSPQTLGAAGVLLVLYVDDVAEVLKRALDAGFTQDGELEDAFFGDRVARLLDPFGYRWSVHQRVETVPPEEIVRRFEAMGGSD